MRKNIISFCVMIILIYFIPDLVLGIDVELTRDKCIDLRYCDWYILDKYVEDIKGLSDPNISLQFKSIKLPMQEPYKSKEGTIWLKCDINVADVKETLRSYLGSRIIIGHIEGNDVTYFNEYPIGVTNGKGITSRGIPRDYLIPPRDIMFGGENSIFIKITSLGSGNPVGVMSEPLTLFNLGDYYMLNGYDKITSRVNILDKLLFKAYSFGYYNKNLLNKMVNLKESCDKKSRKALLSIRKENYKSADGLLEEINDSLSPVNRDLAKFEGEIFNLFKSYKGRLNRAVFDEVTDKYGVREAENVYPSVLSFGRFGKFLNDGLLTFRDVSPTAITLRNGDRLCVSFDEIFNTNVVDINWVNKTTHIKGEAFGKDLSYYLVSTVLFPGVLLNFPENNKIGFEIYSQNDLFPSKIITSNGLLNISDEPVSLEDVNEGWLLFYLNQEKDCPVLMVFERIPDYIYCGEKKDGQKTLIFKNKRASLGKIVILTPFGIEYQNTNKWNTEVPQNLFAKASHLSKIARFFPIYCEEYYKINWDEDVVEVYDIFDYSILKPKYKRGVNELDPIYKLAYLPPQLSFVTEKDYPVQIANPLIDIDVPTFLGPVKGIRTNNNILVYKLPIPPLNERGIVNVGGDKELVAMVNNHINDLGDRGMWNAVDRIYKNRAHSYMAWAYLSDENRNKLKENSSNVVHSGFSADVWFERIEPFSKVRYWFTYFLEGPYYDTYDIDWGNGLALYGYYKYAQYSGDWKLINENWDAIERMMRWFEVSDDWDWMRSSNAVHGHGTGAGDCTTVEYAACVAYTKMARALKKNIEFQKGLYETAKRAIPAVSRFLYRDWAMKYGLIDSDEYIIGFHEGEGFLTAKVDKYLWDYTSNISGNGIEPECFDLYMKYIPKQLKQYEELLDKYNWYDGSYKYPYRTLYQDNSGYITLPHIYARARLGYPLKTIKEYLNSAKANLHLWWQAPAVIAEILSRDADFYLLDWIPAEYKEGFYDGKQAEILLGLFDEGNLFLKIHSNKKPSSVMVNSQKIEKWKYNEEEKILIVEIAGKGDIKVSVKY